MSNCSMIIGEKYRCSKCNKTFTVDEVFEFEDWRCPHCSRRILINIEREKLPDMILERKLIDDIKEGDDFFNKMDFKLYHIYGTKKISKGRVRIFLKDYGHMEFDEDEYINCRANFGYNED